MGMVGLFAFIGFGEFLFNESIKPKHIIYWVSYFFLVLYLANNFNLDVFEYGKGGLLLISSGGVMFLLIAGMIQAIGKEPPEKLFSTYTKLFWGVMYIGMLYPFVFQLGNKSSYNIHGGDWLLFLFGILWVGDTAAMFVGKACGKRKLAPAVSPNKTVEGFIGGIIGAIAIGIIMYYWKFSSLEMYHMILIAVGCSVFGQLGDLVESMWKRSLSIKDSSALIPGHGGVLDRFDSLLFAAPFMYFYINSLL
jgi:phosphatidate cytidylyltransferase